MGTTIMSDSSGGARREVTLCGRPIVAWARIVSPGAMLVGCLLLAVLGSGLSVVYSTHQYRYAFHELQQLREQSNALEVEWGQLLIEQSTFGLESRIERKAMEELELVFPEWSRTVMVRYE